MERIRFITSTSTTVFWFNEITRSLFKVFKAELRFEDIEDVV